jgi:putative membrane protein
MKSALKSLIINAASLQTAIAILPGFKNQGTWRTLLLATLVLAFLNRFLKPLLSLLLLPVNLITLGTFKWVLNVAVLYLLTLVVTELQVQSFSFPGLNYQGFIIPHLEISVFWTLVLVSALISLTNTFLFWISSED